MREKIKKDTELQETETSNSLTRHSYLFLPRTYLLVSIILFVCAIFQIAFAFISLNIYTEALDMNRQLYYALQQTDLHTTKLLIENLMPNTNILLLRVFYDLTLFVLFIIMAILTLAMYKHCKIVYRIGDKTL